MCNLRYFPLIVVFTVTSLNTRQMGFLNIFIVRLHLSIGVGLAIPLKCFWDLIQTIVGLSILCKRTTGQVTNLFAKISSRRTTTFSNVMSQFVTLVTCHLLPLTEITSPLIIPWFANPAWTSEPFLYTLSDSVGVLSYKYFQLLIIVVKYPTPLFVGLLHPLLILVIQLFIP